MRRFYPLSILMIFFLLPQKQLHAESNSPLCGKAIVRFFNDPTKYILSIKVSGLEHRYLYDIERDFFMLRCEVSATGKKYILFNWICGGSGCNEASFGLIDADTGKMRLKPGGRWRRDGNEDKASKMLGHPIQPFSCPTFSRAPIGTLKSADELCFMPLLDSAV